MPTSERGQAGLVPKNIFHGGPKSFRSGEQLHGIFGEGEERQILFQHEQNKLMLLGKRAKSAEQSEQILGHASFAALNHRGGNADSHLGYDGRPRRGVTSKNDEQKDARVSQ